ncbi:MAG: SHOCT domain-containing protein [Leucothrix sp.]
MQNLTAQGENIVSDLSSRYNLSREAIIHMLISVNNGGGSMAQFSSPELGGSGQWMRGGMTMVGDMFNNALRNTVDNLCTELSDSLASFQIFPVVPAGAPESNQWWPSDLGNPFSSGSQNNTRYAIFTGKLVVDVNGQITVYDTLDHNIGGVSQQQGNDSSLTFSSQYGTVLVKQLPVISGQNLNQQPEQGEAEESNVVEPVQADMQDADSSKTDYSADEMIVLIGKLAQLRDSGAISTQDFEAKKLELMARI